MVRWEDVAMKKRLMTKEIANRVNLRLVLGNEAMGRFSD